MNDAADHMTDAEFDAARRDLGRRPLACDVVRAHVFDCRMTAIVAARYGELGPAMLRELNKGAMELAGESVPLVRVLGRRVARG